MPMLRKFVNQTLGLKMPPAMPKNSRSSSTRQGRRLHLMRTTADLLAVGIVSVGDGDWLDEIQTFTASIPLAHAANAAFVDETFRSSGPDSSS
jgi:hypothetical protein